MTAMITYLVSILLLFIQTTETYYVIHVEGKILNKSSGKPIQTGDRLRASDALIFTTEQALAVVLSTKKGRYVLNRPANQPVSARKEAIAIIKNLIFNPVERSNLSTRSVAFSRGTDLKELFADNTFTLLGRQTKIILDKATYPMSSDNYFVCRYEYQGKQVSKKVPFAADTLIFDVNRVYMVNGKFIKPEEAGEAELYFYKLQNKSTTFIGSFIPVFIPQEILKKELQTITDVLKSLNTPRPEIDQHLHEHIQSLYGVTDKNILSQWISEHIKTEN